MRVMVSERTLRPSGRGHVGQEVAAVVRNLNRGGVLALGLCLFLALPADASGRWLYRYVDDKGQVVLRDHIPPEDAVRGYAVIGRDGTVIREVPPQLSDEEFEQQQREQAEQERLRQWDQTLLRRYSSVTDIEAARDRALNEFQVRISILQSNLMALKTQIEREQARAADIERRGSEVPESLVDALRALEREIDDTEDTISRREADAQAAAESFARDIERFEHLQQRVNRRSSTP